LAVPVKALKTLVKSRYSGLFYFVSKSQTSFKYPPKNYWKPDILPEAAATQHQNTEGGKKLVLG
jgi:hypothetical protein